MTAGSEDREEASSESRLTFEQMKRMADFGVPQEHIDWAGRHFRYWEADRLREKADSGSWTLFAALIALGFLGPAARHVLAHLDPEVLLYHRFMARDGVFFFLMVALGGMLMRAWRFRRAAQQAPGEQVQLAIRLFAGPQARGEQSYPDFLAWASRQLFERTAPRRHDSPGFYNQIVKQRAAALRRLSLAALALAGLAVLAASGAGGHVSPDAITVRPAFWPLRPAVQAPFEEISAVELRCERRSRETGSFARGERFVLVYELHLSATTRPNPALWAEAGARRADTLLQIDRIARSSGARFTRGEWNRTCVERLDYPGSPWRDILHIHDL